MRRRLGDSNERLGFAFRATRVTRVAVFIVCVSCQPGVSTSAQEDAPLSLSPAAETLTVGDSIRLLVLRAGALVEATHLASWESSDATVASVESGGWVHARRKGVATITVANGGHFATSSTTADRPPLADLAI